jgi:hypothetical protein
MVSTVTFKIRLLSDVGFTNIEKRPLAGPAEVIIGYKHVK